ARIATDAAAGDRSKIGQHPDEHLAAPAAQAEPAAHAPDSVHHAPQSVQSSAPANGAAARERRVYSPVVQRIAASEGVDLAHVTGTGRGGRVSKQDVLAFLQQRGTETSSEPAQPSEPPLHIESPYVEEPGGEGAYVEESGGESPQRLSR